MTPAVRRLGRATATRVPSAVPPSLAADRRAGGRRRRRGVLPRAREPALQTRANKPYLKLVLGDSTGTIDAMVWDDADLWEPAARSRRSGCGAGSQLPGPAPAPRAVGRADPRLRRRTWRASSPPPAGPREEMERELTELIASVRTGAALAAARCLGEDTETGRTVPLAPGGQAEPPRLPLGAPRALALGRGCVRPPGGALPGPRVRARPRPADRRALLHDIGKLRELKGFPGVVYTTEGSCSVTS
jgi:hypothetical protein